MRLPVNNPPPTVQSYLTLQTSFAFTDRNLLQIPVAQAAPIVNQVTFRYDYDGSKFQTTTILVDAPSVEIYGLQGNQIIESRGLRSGFSAGMLSRLYAQKIFRRYANQPPLWPIRAFHATGVVEVGDLVSLTHPLALDPLTGERGISRIFCEVLEKQPDYQSGNFNFKLLDCRYLSGVQPFMIAAYGKVPAWDAASGIQRGAYAFIARDSNGLMTDEVTEGYAIFG